MVFKLKQVSTSIQMVRSLATRACTNLISPTSLKLRGTNSQ